MHRWTCCSAGHRTERFSFTCIICPPVPPRCSLTPASTKITRVSNVKSIRSAISRMGLIDYRLFHLFHGVHSESDNKDGRKCCDLRRSIRGSTPPRAGCCAISRTVRTLHSLDVSMPSWRKGFEMTQGFSRYDNLDRYWPATGHSLLLKDVPQD